MATEVTKTRTNYFGVKDKKAFEDMVDRMYTNDGKPFLFENSRGEVGFAADGNLFGMIPEGVSPGDLDPDVMETEMIHAIQSVIKPGHACIITDISYNSLKCLNGCLLVITEKKAESVTLDSVGLQMARELLGDPDYEPDMAY